MIRCVIVGGAAIGDYEAVRAALKEDDFLIYCDCGLKHREGLMREPSLIIGDFDSHENPHADIETIVLPHEKDDTDTVFAVKEAVKRGFEEFLLIGVVGNRLDHTLGNVAILEMLDNLGKKAVILDDYSEMEIVGREQKYITDAFPYFSLLNIYGVARHITVKDAYYPLEDAVLTTEFPLGISNEPLKGKTASVSVGEGHVLLIRVRKG